MDELRGPAHCVLSVDVEDWYHILDLPSAPEIGSWRSVPARVEANFERLLYLLETRHVRATCFFLGWVARRFPHLVREASRRGHEIASHGWSHQLVPRLGPEGFYGDAERARMTLEDVCGFRVSGYRAPGFSVTPRTPWFFSKLIEAGYDYDSSVCPARCSHGGLPGAPLGPYVVRESCGEIVEFPLTTIRLAGRSACFSGGGYLRLLPLGLIRTLAHRVLAEGRPVIYYVHPREIDPDQPRLDMSRWRRFKTYVNLADTEQKLSALLREFSFTTFAELVERGATRAIRVPAGAEVPTAIAAGRAV